MLLLEGLVGLHRIIQLKNWCFWTMVLEKTFESPLDSKEIQPSILREISPSYSLEGLMLKLKLQFFVYLMQRTDSFEKTLMLGKIEGERRGWQRMRWSNGITDLTGIVWACLGVGDGQGGLACWSPWGCRVWHDWATELMNWSDLPCLSSFATSFKIFKPFQRTSSLFHWFSLLFSRF